MMMMMMMMMAMMYKTRSRKGVDTLYLVKKKPKIVSIIYGMPRYPRYGKGYHPCCTNQRVYRMEFTPGDTALQGSLNF